MSDHTIAEREDAFDFMAEYPGYGEMRSYTDAVGAEQVAFTCRRMPAGTGGRGSYGHRHKSQEEIYFVVSGEVTFKVNDDVFKAGTTTVPAMQSWCFKAEPGLEPGTPTIDRTGDPASLVTRLG
jgi:mannose-6-phosphate isomerase-like protein (cupin superfamily)